MAENPAASPRTVLRPLSEANHEPGAHTISAVVKIANAIMKPLTKRDWRYQDKVPQTGGVIFVPNHISNADPLAVGQFLAFSGRWPRFLAKASVFRIPIIGRIIAACGQIPVERGSAQSKDALVAAAQALQQGRALVIYPEGTITYDPDLWPMKGKTGSARLALTTGCPIVPIGQWGAQELMPGRKPRFSSSRPRTSCRSSRSSWSCRRGLASPRTPRTTPSDSLSRDPIRNDLDEYEHFGNRRLRAVGELMQEAFRVGLYRM